jgi:hypothetical protein
VFTVFSPFIDRFSPFLTVFRASCAGKSSGIPRAWWRAPLFAPLENGENGENGKVTL